MDSVDRILLRTEDENGRGFGEAAPWPGFPTEDCDAIAEVLRSARGNLSHLRASVEASRGALPCLRAALSSCAHWGEIEAFAGALPCAGLLTNPSAEGVAEKLRSGYRTLKLKVTGGSDLPTIRALIAAAPAGISFRLDANGDLTLEQARDRTAVATRRFARRQESWFGRDPRITWIEHHDPDEVLAQALIAVRAST